jgi:hypothetical protein
MRDEFTITEALIGFGIITILFILGGLITTLEHSMY